MLGTFSAAFYSPPFGSPGKDCVYLSLYALRTGPYDCAVDILGRMYLTWPTSGGEGCIIRNVIVTIVGVEM